MSNLEISNTKTKSKKVPKKLQEYEWHLKFMKASIEILQLKMKYEPEKTEEYMKVALTNITKNIDKIYFDSWRVNVAMSVYEEIKRTRKLFKKQRLTDVELFVACDCGVKYFIDIITEEK